MRRWRPSGPELARQLPLQGLDGVEVEAGHAPADVDAMPRRVQQVGRRRQIAAVGEHAPARAARLGRPRGTRGARHGRRRASATVALG